MDSSRIRPDAAGPSALQPTAKGASGGAANIAATLSDVAASFVELVRSTSLRLDASDTLFNPIAQLKRPDTAPAERKPEAAADQSRRDRAPERAENRSEPQRADANDKPRRSSDDSRSRDASSDSSASNKRDTDDGNATSRQTDRSDSSKPADTKGKSSAKDTDDTSNDKAAAATDTPAADKPAEAASPKAEAAVEVKTMAEMGLATPGADTAAAVQAASKPERAGPKQDTRPEAVAPVDTDGAGNGDAIKRPEFVAANTPAAQAKGPLHGANHMSNGDNGEAARTAAQNMQSAMTNAAADRGNAQDNTPKNTTQQQQQAGLAQLLDDGQSMQVRVTGSDQAAPQLNGPRAAGAAAVAAEATPDAKSAPQTNTGPSIAAQAQVATAARQDGLATASARTADVQAIQSVSDAKGSADVRAPAPTGSANNTPTNTPAGPANTAAQLPQAADRTQATQRPAQPLPTPRAVSEQISVHIARAAEQGVDRINIQLRPESMGRIDVRLELGQDGKMTAHVTADHRDTLDLLQRDQRGLERAFSDAGFNLDKGGINYNLREQNGQGRDGGSEQASNAPAEADVPADEPLPASPVQAYDAWRPGSGRLDIRA